MVNSSEVSKVVLCSVSFMLTLVAYTWVRLLEKVHALKDVCRCDKGVVESQFGLEVEVGFGREQLNSLAKRFA